MIKNRKTVILLGLGLLAALPALLYVLLDHGFLWFVYPDRDRYPVLGIDVSHHQGAIDWEALSETEVQFAWIKATEGGDWVDTRFAENWQGARAAGIVPGAYHFFTFCRPAEDQARNLLSQLTDRDPPILPPVVDIEFAGNCSRRPSPAELSEEVTGFLEILGSESGLTPLIYATRPFAERYLNGVDTSRYEMWIRNIYGHPEGRWRFWQYKSRGRLSGVTGPVDLNVFHSTQQDFDRLVGR